MLTGVTGHLTAARAIDTAHRGPSLSTSLDKMGFLGSAPEVTGRKGRAGESVRRRECRYVFAAVCELTRLLDQGCN